MSASKTLLVMSAGVALLGFIVSMTVAYLMTSTEMSQLANVIFLGALLIGLAGALLSFLMWVWNRLRHAGRDDRSTGYAGQDA